MEKVFQPYSMRPRSLATPGVPFYFGFYVGRHLGFYVPRELDYSVSWLLCPQNLEKRLGGVPFLAKNAYPWQSSLFGRSLVVAFMVVAFMSPENRGRPSVAATQPLCGFHTDHAVRHGRRGRRGRHARKSEATGFHLRPAPHAHTPKIATPRCGGTSVKGASRRPAA